jgi:hypothetical protein
MQKLYIEHSTWLPPLQRSMARFFFNFVPKPNNLYVRIAKLIKQSCWNLEGALVTFNYERLLPIALECAGIQPIVLPLPSEILSIFGILYLRQMLPLFIVLESGQVLNFWLGASKKGWEK